MAFCKSCGQPINESDAICQNCGERITTQENKKDALGEILNKVKGLVGNLNLKNTAIIAGGAVALIVLIVILATALGGNGYEKAFDNVIDATVFGKEKAFKSLAPKEVWKELEDEYDFDMDDALDELKDTSDSILDEFEDEYGKNIKITFKVTDEDELKKSELREIKDTLSDFGIKRKDIKKAVEVDGDLKIKGREDKDEEEATLIFVKIKGDWYIYDILTSLRYGIRLSF